MKLPVYRLMNRR